MHSVSLNTPLLISPHGGKEHNPFPLGGKPAPTEASGAGKGVYKKIKNSEKHINKKRCYMNSEEIDNNGDSGNYLNNL
jgi:hypothetical protein